MLVRPAKFCGRKPGPFAQPRASTAHLEERADLLGKNALPSHATVETRIVQSPAAAQMPDPTKHLFFAIREMLGQPTLEKRRDRERQPNDGVACELRARVGA